MNLNILILDDEENITEELEEYLNDRDFLCFTANSPEQAFNILNKEKIHIAILDIELHADLDGIGVLKKIKTKHSDIEVIMLSGRGTMDTVIEAMRYGASDYVKKSQLIDVELAIKRTSKYMELKKRLKVVENQKTKISAELDKLRDQFGFERMIGESKAILNVKEITRKVAPSDATIFIHGETGTGKELVADAIYARSKRAENPFIKVNCAAIPVDLIESELFGTVRGAFTGAINKAGKFELADGGTVFLDEIGDLSLNAQSKVLRVLQEKQFERIGSNKTIDVDVRIIIATHKDLQEEIKKANFRDDLFYRIHTIPLIIPPLRQRKEDIIPIAKYYLNKFCDRDATFIPEPKFADKAIDKLQSYSWNGNVRELQNEMERLVVLYEGDRPISSEDILPQEHSSTKTRLSLNDIIQEVRCRTVLESLERHNWNKKKVIEELQTNYVTLDKIIKNCNIFSQEI